jgi:predicted glycosyltransferase involved in capsule biosynthesis
MFIHFLNDMRDEPSLSCSVIIHIGGESQPDRVRNTRAALLALNQQDLPRHLYRIILVEQGKQALFRDSSRLGVDEYIFAPNRGAYNRGWAINIGAQRAGPHEILCLLDADFVVAGNFLSRCMDRFENGVRALSPYDVLYLDNESTLALIDSLKDKGTWEMENLKGELVPLCYGGCIFLEASLYHELGGHDERFRGWGSEDREFWDRLSKAVEIERLPGTLLHLDHNRAAESPQSRYGNRQLLAAIRKGEVPPQATPIGDLLKYTGEMSGFGPESG